MSCPRAIKSLAARREAKSLWRTRTAPNMPTHWRRGSDMNLIHNSEWPPAMEPRTKERIELSPAHGHWWERTAHNFAPTIFKTEAPLDLVLSITRNRNPGALVFARLDDNVLRIH